MRLTKFQIDSITECFTKYFPDANAIWLFGSRADESQRGGDIDLYIETSSHDASSIANLKVSFLAELKRKIGDQKIDIVINMLNSDQNVPIYEVAKQNGKLIACNSKNRD